MTNSCFLSTPLFGQTITGTFASDLSKLKASFNPQMTLRQVNLCGTNGSFEGIQGFVSDGETTLSLKEFGRVTSCEAWNVPDGDYIAKLELSYTSLGLQYIMMTTHKNSVKSRGVKLQNSQTYVSQYD